MSESSRTGVQAEICDLGMDFDMYSNWEASDSPPSYSEFKQELIAIMALGEERAIEFSMASNCDFNVEDEAQRLKKEMDITIQEVQESELYKKLVEQIKNYSIIQSNKRCVLGPNCCMQMVIYGLGSIMCNYNSQYQLAIAILLRRDFSCWIGGIEAFDPIMSAADCKVLEMFGCSVLTIDEQCKRQVEKPTLFYLPYLKFGLLGNLLEANWCPTRLNKMFVLGCSFAGLAERCSKSSKLIMQNGKICCNPLRQWLKYVEAIKNHVIELQIDIPNADYGQFVDGFSWHFFNLDLDLNLQSLLPGGLPMDIRPRSKRLRSRRLRSRRLRLRRLKNRPCDFRQLKNMGERYCMEPFYNTYHPPVCPWYPDHCEMDSSDHCEMDSCEMYSSDHISHSSDHCEMDSCEMNSSDHCELDSSDHCEMDSCEMDSSDHCEMDSSDHCEMDYSVRSGRRFHCLWRPPRARWIKLNFSGNTAAGFGGILHDEHKNCLALYSGNMRGKAADSVVANAEALKQGLMCLQYLSPPVRKLIVEGDDMQIIRWVNNMAEPSMRVSEALCEIREFLEEKEVVICHVYEEANSMAVELAKRGTWLPNLRVWVSP